MSFNDLVEMSIPITVKAEQCIRSFSHKATCENCSVICPLDGIELMDNHIVIHQCNGCGKCINQCPLNVFDLDFEKIHIDSGMPLILGCKKNTVDALPIYSTFCLQQFTPIQLGMLVKKYGSITMFSDKNVCEQCECQWFPEGQMVLMEKMGLGFLAKKIHVIREYENLYSHINKNFPNINFRRQYFSNQYDLFKKTGEKFVVQMVQQFAKNIESSLEDEQNTAFTKTISNNMQIYQMLQGEETQEKNDILGGIKQLVNIRCRFCKICEQLCPWEAIKIFEADEEIYLQYHDVLCSQCGLCLDLCPEKGFMWEVGLPTERLEKPVWRTLACAELKKCSVCGEKFANTSDDEMVCYFCQIKTQ